MKTAEEGVIVLHEEDHSNIVGWVAVAAFGFLAVMGLATESLVRQGLGDLFAVLLVLILMGFFLIWMHARIALTFGPDKLTYQGFIKKKTYAYTEISEVSYGKKLMHVFAKDGWKLKYFQVNLSAHPEVITLLKQNKVSLVPAGR